MDIIAKLNWIDLLIVIIMLRMSYVAFEGGLSHEILPLIGAACSLVLSLHYYSYVAELISRNAAGKPGEISVFLSFTALAILIGLVFKLLRNVMDAVIRVSWHPLIEKFGGLVVGIAKSSMLVSIVLIIMALMPLPYLQRSIRDKSLTGGYFISIGPTIYEKAARFLPAVKIGAPPQTKEGMMQYLLSDKSIFPKTEKKMRCEDTPEWEKIR